MALDLLLHTCAPSFVLLSLFNQQVGSLVHEGLDCGVLQFGHDAKLFGALDRQPDVQLPHVPSQELTLLLPPF